MQRTSAPAPYKQRGFSLIECLIALLILTIGLLGNAALQANLSKESAKSESRVKATNLAKVLSGQMMSDYTHLATYAYPGGANSADWAVAVKKLPGAVEPVVTVNADGSCVITIYWTLKQDNIMNSYSVPFTVDSTL